MELDNLVKKLKEENDAISILYEQTRKTMKQNIINRIIADIDTNLKTLMKLKPLGVTVCRIDELLYFDLNKPNKFYFGFYSGRERETECITKSWLKKQSLEKLQDLSYRLSFSINRIPQYIDEFITKYKKQIEEKRLFIPGYKSKVGGR